MLAKRRVAAVGDLHGDYVSTLQVLQMARITNRAGHWIAKDAVLVQTVSYQRMMWPR